MNKFIFAIDLNILYSILFRNKRDDVYRLLPTHEHVYEHCGSYFSLRLGSKASKKKLPVYLASNQMRG